MEKKSLISIIVPVYNGSNYLCEAIDSALVQTYTNVEIIVVNDGSNDDGRTEEVALTYGNKIKYFSKPNGGVGSALNYAIEKSTGAYISWLSHDDVYKPNKLERLALLMSDLPANTILYTDYELIDCDSKQIGIQRLNNIELTRKPIYSLLRGAMHGCSMLIPREAFDECGLFNESLKTTQDYDLWFRMRKKYTFHHVPEVLISSRFHDDQDSKKHPDVIREGNELWIRFAEEITEEEILSVESSQFIFFKKLHEFLALNTQYVQAINRIKYLANKYEKGLSSLIHSYKISVIIPFYNRIEWTISAVKSALCQTLKPFEIILIDNNSTENTDALKALANEFDVIKYFTCKKQGPSAARNVGLINAKGDFIAFLDSDDLWLPRKLEKQIYHMLREGSDLSYTDYELFDSDSHITLSRFIDKSENVKFPHMIINCPIATPTVILKRDIINLFKITFDEEAYFGEDLMFWLTISYCGIITRLDQILTRVRAHENLSANNKELPGRCIINTFAKVVSNYQWEEYKEALPSIFHTLYCIYGHVEELPQTKPTVLPFKKRLKQYLHTEKNCIIFLLKKRLRQYSLIVKIYRKMKGIL